MRKKNEKTAVWFAALLGGMFFATEMAVAGPLDILAESGTIAMVVTAVITLLAFFGVWSGIKKYILKLPSVEETIQDFADIFVQLAEAIRALGSALADDKITKEEVDQVLAELNDVIREAKEFLGHFRGGGK